MRPTPGTIYVARSNPAFRVLVEEVSTPEPDGFFLVDVANPDDPAGMGYQLDSEQWAGLAHDLSPA